MLKITLKDGRITEISSITATDRELERICDIFRRDSMKYYVTLCDGSMLGFMNLSVAVCYAKVFGGKVSYADKTVKKAA